MSYFYSSAIMNILDRITTIGYNPSLNSYEQTRIKLINISSAFALISIFLFNLSFCIIDFKNTIVMVIMLSLFFIPFGYVLILNSKGKYVAAKLLSLIASTASIFIPCIFLGSKFEFQHLFLVLTIGPFLINGYLTTIFITILNASAFIYVDFFYKSQLLSLDGVLMRDSIVLIYSIATISISFIILAILLINFQLVLIKEDKELEIALESITILANCDNLTSLYNRRAFNEIMLNEVKKIISQTTLSLIISDIDHFKNVNDTYGHLMGDEVLKRISDELKNNLKEDYTIARWGGEEFIIMLPHTDISESKIVAEKLRLCIEELTFTSNMHITMSFGVTQYQFGEDISNIVKRADDALYMAKFNGRNRVEIG